jgi:hypothetical protein
MLSGMRLSSSVSLNSDSIRMAGSTERLFGTSTTRTSSAIRRDILQQRQLAGHQQLGDLFDQPRLLHLDREFR